MSLTVTFYSYKGGVGRTLLAANMAVLLARHGRTLLCDFDLEAPGLHRIGDLATSRPNQRGLFEWLYDWQEKRHFDQPNLRDLDRLATAILPAEKQERLFILPAHGTGANAAKLYQSIDWPHFLADNPDLGLSLLRDVLRHLREKHHFRYLLLDARTGITDIGGFLAALLPDVTVLVGNYGAQNTGGLKGVWEGLKSHADDARRGNGGLRRPLQIRLVASPIPDEGPDIRSRLKQIWEKDFELAAGSLIEIPERSDLRRTEALLTLNESDSPIVGKYHELARALLTIESDIEADNAAEALAVRQRRDLFDPADPRLRTAQGKGFEERVADLLRMLGYRVETEQTLDGNRVDLVATLKQGLDETAYLVECKDHKDAVGTAVVDTLDSWLRRPRAVALQARGMIVGRRFSPQALEAAKGCGIRCFTPEDLERALLDFSPYLNRLIADFAHSALAQYYVPQQIQTEKDEQTVDLLTYALAWAGGEGNRLWVLLGDYGTGKTAFTRRFAYELAQQALGRSSAEVPLPLLINLRDFPNKTSLGDLLHEHWHRQTGERRDPAIFLHLQARGRLILLLDSFDEMGISQAHRNVVEQFRMLAQPTGSGGDNNRANRVLLTCREQFFREQGEALQAVRGQTDRLAALEQAARGFDGAIDLLPRFSDGQIREYLHKRLGADAGRRAWTAIDRLYNLKSLADRPQLLEMIIESLPDLLREGQTVSPGALYLRYTNRWLEDPAIRPADRQSSSTELRGVLEALAVELWRRDGQRIHHADLYQLISQRGELRGRHDPIVLDVELRTAAFLSRTPDGYYGFSHRSFLEFFYARALLQALHAAASPQAAALALGGLLAAPRPSRELAEFFADLLAASPPLPERSFIEQAVTRILADPSAAPTTRRNAYLLSYWVSRRQADEDVATAHSAWLPQAPQRLELAGCRCNDLALPSALLADANLADSTWDRSDLSDADLRGAGAGGASFTACRLRNVTLAAARIEGTCFNDADADGADLTGARAAGSQWIAARLTGARLTDADFSGADLRGARLAGCRGVPELAGARLEGATAPGAKHPDLPRMPATTLVRFAPWLHQGHNTGISSVVYSPDGSRLLSGSHDNTLRLWDIETGQEIRAFAGHQASVSSVAFSPDGTRMLSGSYDRTLRLWDAASGHQIRVFSGHRYAVWSVAFSPDGRSLLSGSLDHTMRLWNAKSGQEIRVFDGHKSRVSSVAFSPNGRHLLSGGEDRALRLWDEKSGREIRAFLGHQGSIWSVAFSPDGRRILSGSADKTLRLWDVESGQEIRAFSGHQAPVWSVAFSPDGHRLLSGSHDSTVRLWDPDSGQEIRIFSTPSPKDAQVPALGIAFSPDGRSILSGDILGTLRIWDAESGQEVQTFSAKQLMVLSVAFSPDGSRLLSGSLDNALHLWDAKSGMKVRSFFGLSTPVSSVAFSPDGQHVLSGSDKMRLWGTESGRETLAFAGLQAPVSSVAFSPDGRWLLSGSNENTLRLWDAESGREIRTFSGHQAPVLSVAFSRDGCRLLSGSNDNTLRLWDTESGKEIRTLIGHQSSVSSVAFSPDDRHLLSGSADNTLRLWDAESGHAIRDFAGHQAWVRSVAFSPDGRRLLSGSGDNTLRLWDVASGKQIRALTGHQAIVFSIAFSPDGSLLLSGSADNTIRLWDAESGRQLRWCWANGDQWFTLDMASFQPMARFADLQKPMLRGHGPVPLAFVEPIDHIPPAPWIPRHWLADDLPELWFPES